MSRYFFACRKGVFGESRKLKRLVEKPKEHKHFAEERRRRAKKTFILILCFVRKKSRPYKRRGAFMIGKDLAEREHYEEGKGYLDKDRGNGKTTCLSSSLLFSTFRTLFSMLSIF